MLVLLTLPLEVDVALLPVVWLIAVVSMATLMSDGISVFVLGLVYVSAGVVLFDHGQEYLGVVLVILYAGALMVLFAFVVLIGLECPSPARSGCAPAILPAVALMALPSTADMARHPHCAGGMLRFGVWWLYEAAWATLACALLLVSVLAASAVVAQGQASRAAV